MPIRAKFFVTFVIATASPILVWALASRDAANAGTFAIYLLIALVASTLKVTLPGLEGTISPAFVLVVASALTLGKAETVLIAATSAFVQCIWKPVRRPAAIQAIFAACTLAIASFSASNATGWLAGGADAAGYGLASVATVVLFGVNSTLVAIVLCLVQQKSLTQVWRLCNAWSFPYYLAGSIIAGAVTSIQATSEALILVSIPMLYALFASYRKFAGRQVLVPHSTVK